MGKEVKISNTQVGILVLIAILGGQILFIPANLVEISLNDSWISSVLGVVFGLLYIVLYTSFAKHFPEKTFHEMNVSLLGKWLGTSVTYFVYIYFILLSAVMVRDFCDFLKIQMLTNTPEYAIHLLFVAVVVIGGRCGLEVIARTAELAFPFMIGLFLFLTLFSLPDVELKQLQPLFGTGLLQITSGTLRFQFFSYLQLVIFALLFPLMHAHNIRRPFLIGGIVGGIMLTTITILALGILGTDLLLDQLYPSYILAKKIYIGDFITRMEVLIAALWFLTLYFKTVITFFGLTLGLAQSCHLSSYRVVNLPLGLLIFILSLTIYPNTQFYIHVLPYWNTLIIIIGLVIPLCMSITLKIKNMDKRKNEMTSN